MKKLILLSIFLCFQWGFGKISLELREIDLENLRKSKISSTEAYSYLEKTLNIDYNGYVDIYLKVLLDDENSEELLEKLFNNSNNPTIKVISLQGLYEVNHQKYTELKKEVTGLVSIDFGVSGRLEKVETYLDDFEREKELEAQ